MFKKWDSSEEAIAERAKKYGCDGKCYEEGCCGAIDTCPATREREGLATIIAILFCIGSFIFSIMFIIYLLYIIIKFLLRFI